MKISNQDYQRAIESAHVFTELCDATMQQKFYISVDEIEHDNASAFYARVVRSRDYVHNASAVSDMLTRDEYDVCECHKLSSRVDALAYFHDALTRFSDEALLM